MKSSSQIIKIESSSNGFTLIEILAAVGIVVLVGALLLAGVARIQEEARGAKNLSNHREIARALIQSAYDNGGVLPYCYDDTDKMRLSYPRHLAQAGYIADPRVFFSPNAGDWYTNYNAYLKRPHEKTTAPWFYSNYGANRSGAMPNSQDDKNSKPARLTAVAADGNLSKLMLLRDTYRSGNDTAAQPWGGGVCFFSGSGGWNYIPPEKKTYRGQVYASFADGHVKRFPRQEMLDATERNESLEPFFKDRYTKY